MADQPAQSHVVRTTPRLRRSGALGMILVIFLGWFCAATATASELRETAVVRALKKAWPAVVSIRGEKTLTPASLPAEGIDAGKRVNGMGTGVVIDPRGYILTNHHVVDGVREIHVSLADGSEYIAQRVARDPETDLAIIKIKPREPLTMITLGTSSDLMLGEPVIALGNAFGYSHTATRGIVSALHRAVQVSDAQFYEDLIQTDASINPGNSGGPLLNIDGEMIGINVAVRAGAQGIGFAIPVDRAVVVCTKLLAALEGERAWHGVRLAEEQSPTEGRGPQVASVDQDSPAARAGLEPGDRIKAVGETETRRPIDFHRTLLEAEPGQKITLLVDRMGQTFPVELELAAAVRKPLPAVGPHWELLGVRLEPVSRDEFRQRFNTRYRGGLAISAVRPESPAAAQGLQTGDVLVGMHVWETVSLDNVDYIIRRIARDQINPVKFYILRGEETYFGYLPLPAAVAHTAQR